MSTINYIHHFPQILKPEQIQLIYELLAKAPFVDGKSTAFGAASDIKKNLQVDVNDTIILPQLQQIIGMAMNNEPRFQTDIYASKVYPFLFSRYETKMSYGWHVDSPIMGYPPVRTDLAMTIFLSEPDSYEGGELAIKSNTGEETKYKPAMGDAIIYPCQYVHCVKDITKGTRLAVVTWIQSSVKSMEQRAILSNLKHTQEQLASINPQSDEAQSILQTWSNLLRMWSEV